MNALDRIFAPIALLAFGAYLVIVITHVPRFGLVLVSIIAFLLGAYDFALTLLRRRRMEQRKRNEAAAQ
jgi:hypothetical protein